MRTHSFKKETMANKQQNMDKVLCTPFNKDEVSKQTKKKQHQNEQYIQTTIIDIWAYLYSLIIYEVI